MMLIKILLNSPVEAFVYIHSCACATMIAESVDKQLTAKSGVGNVCSTGLTLSFKYAKIPADC